MEERPEKMYGLFDLNHHLLEKMCDVTSVTEDERTEEEESGKVSCILVDQKPQLRNSTNTTKKYQQRDSINCIVFCAKGEAG